MDKIKDPRLIPSMTEDVKSIEENLLYEGLVKTTQRRQISLVKQVAKRRRLGRDLWKEVTRKEHRVARSVGK